MRYETKKKKNYINKPRNTDLLIALLHESNFLHLLKGRYYDSLINYLINIAPLYNDENSTYSLPTIKKISEDLNERRIHSWLPKIVDDLIELNNEQPELFNLYNSNFKYFFHAHDEFNDLSISYYIWTNMLLKEAEHINWPFSKSRLSSTYLWIKEINHTYENGILKSDVFLDHRIQNKYRDFIYDRAEFERKINFFERHSLSRYEIDELLKSLYSNK